MEDQNKEVWEPILSGYYEISNKGRVRRACSGHSTYQGKILQPRHGNRYNLSIEGHAKEYTIKQLHEMAFGPGKLEGFEVGKCYRITHSKKGYFAIKVTRLTAGWVHGVIVEGRTTSINPELIRTVGDDVGMRISLIVNREEIDCGT